MSTLEEFRRELQREAAERRLALAADAARFALSRDEDEEFPELREHWKQQVKDYVIVQNEIKTPVELLLTLTDEENALFEHVHAKTQPEKPPVPKQQVPPAPKQKVKRWIVRPAQAVIVEEPVDDDARGTQEEELAIAMARFNTLDDFV